MFSYETFNVKYYISSQMFLQQTDSRSNNQCHNHGSEFLKSFYICLFVM